MSLAFWCDEAAANIICSALWYGEAASHLILHRPVSWWGDLTSDIEALHFEASEDDLEVKEDEYEETNGTTVISEQKSIIRDPDDHQVPYPFNVPVRF